MVLHPARLKDERRSKCSEESRRAQIAREQAMRPEIRVAAAERMEGLAALLRPEAKQNQRG